MLHRRPSSAFPYRPLLWLVWVCVVLTVAGSAMAALAVPETWPLVVLAVSVGLLWALAAPRR